MRKNTLRQFANNPLATDPSGSHRDRKHRSFVINKVMNDLFKMGQCPPHWHALNQGHVQALVRLWQKQNIKTVSIMKYMTCLRYFLKRINHPIANINNLSLQLIRTKHQANDKPISLDAVEQISNPFIKVMFRLQIEFGLTFSETTRLVPDIHIREHLIWLTRDITFNHQDRTIPIRSNLQLGVLEECRKLTNSEHSMIAMHGHRAVLRTYHRFMTLAGLSPQKSYRYLYAKNQYHELSQTLSHQEVYQMLMLEMGLKSRTTLWAYLHE